MKGGDSDGMSETDELSQRRASDGDSSPFTQQIATAEKEISCVYSDFNILLLSDKLYPNIK